MHMSQCSNIKTKDSNQKYHSKKLNSTVMTPMSILYETPFKRMTLIMLDEIKKDRNKLK